MARQVVEGTWEVIATHTDEMVGKRVTVSVQPDEIPGTKPPKEAMLTTLREIAEHQNGRHQTEGDSIADVRYGRSDPIYGMPFMDGMGI